MPRNFKARKPNKTNCLWMWKRIRDSSVRPRLIRGPEDDGVSFYYDPKGQGDLHIVTVLVGAFILLLPKKEQSAAIAWFEDRGARFDKELILQHDK